MKKNIFGIVFSLMILFVGLWSVISVLSQFFFVTVDDAFITFRYSWNLLHGNGFVFNPGVFVEGTSSPFWAFILTGIGAFGANIEYAAKIFSLVCLILCIPLLYLKSCKDKSQYWLAAIATFTIWSIPSAVLWSVFGLETILFATLILILLTLSTQLAASSRLSVYTESSKWHWTGLFLVGVALVITRPEGILFPYIALVGLFFYSRQNRGSTLRVGIALFIFLSLITLFRLVYFGDWLPNTYYAKAIGLSFNEKLLFGSRYLATWWKNWWWLTLPSLFILLDREYRRFFYFGFLLVGAECFFILVSCGSDWMPAQRHALTILPILSLLAVQGISVGIDFLNKHACRQECSISWKCIIVAVLIVPIALINHHRQLRSYTPFLAIYEQAMTNLKEMGRWIKSQTHDGDYVAARDIGALSFYSQRNILDLVGLTDRHIARSSGFYHRQELDVDYVFAYKPRIIIIDTPIREDQLISPENVTKPLFYDTRFLDSYVKKRLFRCPRFYDYYVFERK